METDKDEGGSCKRFTDPQWIRNGSPMERYGDPWTGLQMKKGTKDWSFDCFFNSHTLCVSIRSRSGLFWVIFVGMEASRMKVMPRKTSRMGLRILRIIRTLTDELQMRYGRATDTMSI